MTATPVNELEGETPEPNGKGQVQGHREQLADQAGDDAVPQGQEVHGGAVVVIFYFVAGISGPILVASASWTRSRPTRT